jgi:hypothetical protein
MIAYVAMGGGHGHAMRGLALLSRLGRGTLVAPERHRDWARQLGVDFATTVPDVGFLLVDTFPRGVTGDLELRAPAWLVARWTRPDFYASRLDAIARFERVVWCEQPSIELPGALQLPPVLLGAPPLPRDEARRDLGAASRPLLLALGLGDRQRPLLEKITRRLDVQLRFLDDRFPAARWLPAADVVVSAAGYTAFHEIEADGVPAVFLPQSRQYDDQFLRARSRPVAHDPPQLENWIARLLQSPRRPASAPDGAARLAALVERRMKLGVLPQEEIAPVALR